MTERATTLTPVTVGTFTTSSILAVAQRGGFLERQGIDVEIVECASSRQQMEGLRDRRFDLIHTSPDNIMRERLENGTDALVFFVLDSGLPQHLVTRCHTWSQLAGGVIGLDDPASGFTFVVHELLRLHGIDPFADCRLVEVGSSRRRFEALQEGTIDACLLSSTMAGRAQKLGFTSLATAGAVLPWYPGIAAATARSYAEQHQKIMTGYIAALTAALRWSTTNQPEAYAMVADAMEISTAEAEEIVESEAAARTAACITPEEATENLRRVAALRERATGQVLSDYFDPSWMAAAQRP